MYQKEFLMFYMSQLWALHVVIKRQFMSSNPCHIAIFRFFNMASAADLDF